MVPFFFNRCFLFYLVHMGKMIEDVTVTWTGSFRSARPDKVLSYKAAEIYLEITQGVVWSDGRI